MGEELIQFYKTKVKRNWKIAFISVFIIGLATHIYKFTNILLNHDSVFNFYSDQNIVSSGRWFLSIVCGISSYFDLPWINGLLSILYIAITAVIVVDLFDIKNEIAIILSSGILVTSPFVTETLFFNFTADGYFLALLLSALALYLCQLKEKKIYKMILSGICICLSCGIYQSYVSFTMVLALCYLIHNLMLNKYDIKTYLKWLRNSIIILVVSLASYFAIWKICLFLQNIEADSYQGISQVGQVDFSIIFSGLKKALHDIFIYFFERNILQYPINLFGVFNAIFILFFIAGIVVSVIKSGAYKRKFNIGMIIASVLMIIPSMFIWHFVSESTEYRPMMLGSVSVLFIFAVVLYNKWIKTKVSNIFAVFMVCVIFNFAVMSNIAYNYMERENIVTLTEAQDMYYRINEIKSEEEFDEIYIYGKRNEELSLISEETSYKIHMYARLLEKSLLLNGKYVYSYLSNIYDMDIPLASEETGQEIEKTQEFKNMEAWPSPKSITVINNTLVIKLSNTE